MGQGLGILAKQSRAPARAQEQSDTDTPPREALEMTDATVGSLAISQATACSLHSSKLECGWPRLKVALPASPCSPWLSSLRVARTRSPRRRRHSRQSARLPRGSARVNDDKHKTAKSIPLPPISHPSLLSSFSSTSSSSILSLPPCRARSSDGASNRAAPIPHPSSCDTP
jgi:hypothetical protein